MSDPEPVTTAAAAGEVTQRGLLRNRHFLEIWSAQLLSQTAANAITYALSVLVFERTGSNTAASLLILLAIVPAIMFGSIAGVLVDRSDRKLVLVITNVGRAIACALLLPLGESTTAAYVVNFLVALATVFFVPAEAATLPKIVGKSDLLAANSLFSLTFNGSFVLGFSVVAPVLIALAGFEALFVLLTAIYLVAAALCSLLPKAEAGAHLTVQLAEEAAREAATETRRDFREALSYLRLHARLVWVLIYIAITYMLIAVAGALAPGFVSHELERPAREVIYLSLPAGVGIVLGLLALNLLAHRISRATAMHVGLAATGLALLGLALAGPALRVMRRFVVGSDPQQLVLAYVVVAALVFGLAYIFITVPSFTLLQEELRDDMRGRVFGVLNTLVSVVSLAPLVFIGTIADLYGIVPVFIFASLLMFGTLIAGRTSHLPRAATAEIGETAELVAREVLRK